MAKKKPYIPPIPNGELENQLTEMQLFLCYNTPCEYIINSSGCENCILHNTPNNKLFIKWLHKQLSKIIKKDG